MKRIFLLLALLLAGPHAFAQTNLDADFETRQDGYRTATWTALAKNYAGSPANAGSWRGIKTVQIIVTSAGEQSVAIQGSNDGSTWFTLRAAEIDSGTGSYLLLSGLTTSGGYTILDDPLFIRPLVSNEAGATPVDIDVILGGIL